jgi:protein-S-isoprenylcysteine O-methyltransferase Ste14
MSVRIGAHRVDVEQILPRLLLTVLYFSICVSKILDSADALTRALDGDHLRYLLLSLHGISTTIFFGILGIISMIRKEPIRRERRVIGWALPFIVMLAMGGVGLFAPRDMPNVVLVFATFFVIAGTGFTIYALRHLGRHFGVVSDVRGLVTSGPYRWMRHPLYGGEALTMIGLVIAVANPASVAAFTIGFGLQIWRAKVEEQSLTAAFPEYREYAARTPMLIPLTRFRFRPAAIPAVD